MAPFEPTWTPRLETAVKQAQRLAEARRRGEERLANEPRAIAFAYDFDTQRYTLGLAGGTTLSFYAATLPELACAQPEDLKAVAILSSGGGLRWERLDLDVPVPGLVLSLFAGSEWQKAIRQVANRQAARSGSDARLRASRENGKKGGRPRKNAPSKAEL